MQLVRVVPASIIPVLLTGCATLPQLPSEEQLSTQKIVDHVQCELALAWAGLPANSPIRNWDAGFTLDLKVRTDSGIALGADKPIAFGAGLLPSVAIKASGNATRSSTMKFDSPMSSINSDLVEACRAEPMPTETTSWRLQGSLGVGEWVDRMARVIDAQDDRTSPTKRLIGSWPPLLPPRRRKQLSCRSRPSEEDLFGSGAP
jgi:hypothetical protein